MHSRYTLFNATVTSAGLLCGTLSAIADVLHRIEIAPQRGHNAFLSLLAAADVVVDSFPFGVCMNDCPQHASVGETTCFSYCDSSVPKTDWVCCKPGVQLREPDWAIS